MPYDLMLWEFSKDNVDRERLTFLSNLKNSIRYHIQNIHFDSLLSVVESAIYSMECVVEHNGLYIEVF